MPSESEHKIEELLRAYAKKRREDAGDPVSLPPATRKLLQAEVARQWAPQRGALERGAAGRLAGADAASFLQLLRRFWPRLAFAAVLVMGLGGVVWLSTLNPKRQQQLAQNANKMD